VGLVLSPGDKSFERDPEVLSAVTLFHSPSDRLQQQPAGVSHKRLDMLKNLERFATACGKPKTIAKMSVDNRANY